MRLRFSKKSYLLAFISVVIVLYFEWIYQAKALSQCTWPLGPTAKHIVIITDPQLVDDHTYPNRNRLVMWFTRFFSDRFMSRNYRLIHSKLDPDAIFFLGDLFDGGREWENKEWMEEYQRYRKIFPISPKVQQYENLPGNHDVGSTDDIIPSAFDRFKKYFGKPNQVINIAGHSIVTLDTNSMMNGNREEINGPVYAFFKDLKDKQKQYDPIIVLSHIPLYRPEDSYCGLERETKPFSWVKGHQYITEISPEITTDILQGLKPEYIFSGDDHDVCKYTHRYGTDGETEEHTVKTFSLAMNMRRPGFQVLSLDTKKQHETKTCYTADPFNPLIWQGVLLVLLLSGCFIIPHIINSKGKRLPELPVSNKPSNLRPSDSSAVMREFKNSALIIGVWWFLSQVLIHWWSYSKF